MKLTMSASCPARVRMRSPPAADEDRRVRPLHRQRQSGEAVGVDVRAVDVDLVAASSGPSSARRPRRGGRCARPAESIVTPSPSYSAATQPAPSPTSSRPSESRSSVAISLASTTGWWRSTLNTRHPTRSRGGHRGGRRHRRDRRDVDRPVARRVGDRAGTEVVIGGEQRAVAEVLGSPGESRATPCPTWPRRPGRRSETGVVRGSHGPSNGDSPCSVFDESTYSTSVQ